MFSGDDGVTIAAAASDEVVLNGLTINGQGGNRGIVVTAAGKVSIENCAISGMHASGIQVGRGLFATVGNTIAVVANSTLAANSLADLHQAASSELRTSATNTLTGRGAGKVSGTLTANPLK